jgi:hypothetical protein
LKLDANGHLGFTGNPPTLDPDCGSTEFEGTDIAGGITFLGGEGVTRCDVIFNQSYSTNLQSRPACIISWAAEAIGTITITTGPTGFTMRTEGGAQFAGDVYYLCVAL